MIVNVLRGTLDDPEQSAKVWAMSDAMAGLSFES